MAAAGVSEDAGSLIRSVAIHVAGLEAVHREVKLAGEDAVGGGEFVGKAMGRLFQATA